MTSRVQGFCLFFWQNGASQAVDGCQIKFLDTCIIYVFGFLEPFRPHLALKLSKKKAFQGKLIFWENIQNGYKKTRNFMMILI
jgi:hypothetical protein